MRANRLRALTIALSAAAVWFGFAAADSSAARATTVPVEVATGPTFFQLDRPRPGSGRNAIAADQPWHFGWRLEIAAVIDEEWARENPSYVPPGQRERIAEFGEVRYRPGPLSVVPRSLIISPKVWDTGLYGATWELLRVGIGGGLEWLRLRARGGVVATYAFMHSEADGLAPNFHFLRPGIDVELGLYIPFGEAGGFRIGWTSNIYVPQAIGGGIFQFGGTRGSLWHIGEAYALLHFRFPYELR